MRDGFVFLFYGWLALSVLIYLRRIFTTRSVRPGGSRKGAAVDTASARAPEAPVPMEAVVAREADAASTGAAASTAATPIPTPVATLDRPALSLAEALEGVQLPHDLVPLMGPGGIDPRHMAFVTSGVPAEVVGAAVADELERLGYGLNPVNDRTVVALRGATRLEARIHPSRTQAEELLGTLVATAPHDAVVVDISLR